ncbi:MAG: response regulator transcription factor [Chitinophagaceae bacterium]
MKIRCIAVDDEPLALGLLADNISRVPFLELVSTCLDAFEAIKVFQEKQVDLVFIDIQMPGLTGIQFIESLVQKPMVILITAYKQYALDSYNLQVVDYLVKPVAMDRFLKACNKALELFQLRQAGRQLVTSSTQAASQDFFFVNADYSLVKVMFDDIVWVEGLRDYVKIHLKSTNKAIISRMSIRSIEEQLPSGRFIRIHKSYIVGVDGISAVRKNSVFLGEMELPVGDTYKGVVDKLTGRED